jgi:hypothetical protein
MMSIDGARKRGRPRVDSTSINVRLAPDALTSLDKWIAGQPDAPSRPEAIRRIVAEKLPG